MSAQEQNSEQREARQTRLMVLQMSRGGRPLQEIVARNLSNRGIGAFSKTTMPLEGDQVVVHFPQGQQATGVVRWVLRQNFGILLDQDIDPSLIQPKPRHVQIIDATPGKWHVCDRYKPETEFKRPGLRIG
jgi:hypothetical protein